VLAYAECSLRVAHGIPARHFDAVTDEERLLDVVRALVSELGHQPALASVGPGSAPGTRIWASAVSNASNCCCVSKQAFGTRLDDESWPKLDYGAGPDLPRSVP